MTGLSGGKAPKDNSATLGSTKAADAAITRVITRVTEPFWARVVNSNRVFPDSFVRATFLSGPRR